MAVCHSGARPTFLADLRFDAHQCCQSGNAVRTPSAAVIVMLVIAIDLAAVLLALADKFSLSKVFLRPLAQRVLQPSIEAAGFDAKERHSAARKIPGDALR